MKVRCVMCGRPTVPAVMIGREPVGPKCAARAGLTARKAPRGASIKFLGRTLARKRADGQQQLDMFDQEAGHADQA